MRRILAFVFVLLASPAIAYPPQSVPPPPISDYAGVSTVAGLPVPSTVIGKRFYVTDLGGGAGPVYSLGSCYKRVVQSVAPALVQATSQINVTNLVQTLVFQLTAPPSLLSNVTINATGLCPGDILTVYIPNGVLTAAGTLGVSLNSAAAITLTGLTSAYSADFLWTGSSALKLRGGYIQ